MGESIKVNGFRDIHVEDRETQNYYLIGSMDSRRAIAITTSIDNIKNGFRFSVLDYIELGFEAPFIVPPIYLRFPIFEGISSILFQRDLKVWMLCSRLFEEAECFGFWSVLGIRREEDDMVLSLFNQSTLLGTELLQNKRKLRL